MTTIVYDHAKQQIAIDSRVTCSGLIVSDNDQKYQEDENGFWFLSGCVSDFDLLIDAFKDGDRAYNLKAIPDASAIFVRNDGDVFLRGVTSNGEAWTQKLNSSRCIGSGSNFAIAALDFGKSAKEAVQYAATRDVYTGGVVRVCCLLTGMWDIE